MCVHIYSYVYSALVAAICVVSGRALCDLLCINLRCVYITRGLQDNDRSMRHARINGPHGYMVYCTHRGPLSLCARSYFPLCRCSSCYHEMHDTVLYRAADNVWIKKKTESSLKFRSIEFYSITSKMLACGRKWERD